MKEAIKNFASKSQVKVYNALDLPDENRKNRKTYQKKLFP